MLLQARGQLIQCLSGKSRAHPTGIVQRPVIVVDAQQQRAETGPRARRIGETKNDEFLGMNALDFKPVSTSTRPVRLIPSL